MIAASLGIDLIAPVDGVLGTDLDAGVAARAKVEIDRIFLRPGEREAGGDPLGAGLFKELDEPFEQPANPPLGENPQVGDARG